MKSAYEHHHVKSVTAWALVYKNEHAGKLVANWSDNPHGSVCTVTINIWDGPLKTTDAHMTARAGGYGYDKLSQAVHNALERGGHKPTVVSPGNGRSKEEFTAHGYEVFDVLGG